MTIEPQSRLTLLGYVNLTDYKNQLDFSSREEQATYFLGKKFMEFQDFRYIRKDNAIVVPYGNDALISCDYLMFKNVNFSDKWFYAFITNREYISDSATKIYFRIDVFQTWQFNVIYLRSFISRMHTKQENYPSGTPFFENLYPEQLEYGRDYVVTHTETISFEKYITLICSSASLEGDHGDISNPQLNSSTGGTFDRMPSSLNYYIIDDETSSFNALLEELKEAPWVAQCIQSVTVVPAEIGAGGTLITTEGGTKIKKMPDGFESPNYFLNDVTNYIKNFPNYTNKKLYSYPYSYIEMTCYNGAQFIIKPESINGADIELRLMNYVGSQPRLAYIINNYNTNGDNGTTLSDGREYFGEFLDTGVVMGNFPQLPVMVDNYLLYMANNSNSFSLSNSINNYNKKEAVTMGAIEGGMGMVSSALSGNIGGVVGSAYSGAKSAYMGVKNSEIAIRQQMAKIQDAEISPPTLSGQTGGDAFNISNGINGITLKWKTIREQYAENLDAYFTRYGYAINKIDVPVLRTNLNFNYIQTTGIILAGNIPQDDMEQLKDMFDNGTTIWHNGKLGQYTDNPYIGKW